MSQKNNFRIKYLKEKKKYLEEKEKLINNQEGSAFFYNAANTALSGIKSASDYTGLTTRVNTLASGVKSASDYTGLTTGVNTLASGVKSAYYTGITNLITWISNKFGYWVPNSQKIFAFFTWEGITEWTYKSKDSLVNAFLEINIYLIDKIGEFYNQIKDSMNDIINKLVSKNEQFKEILKLNKEEIITKILQSPYFNFEFLKNTLFNRFYKNKDDFILNLRDYCYNMKTSLLNLILNKTETLPPEEIENLKKVDKDHKLYIMELIHRGFMEIFRYGDCKTDFNKGNKEQKQIQIIKLLGFVNYYMDNLFTYEDEITKEKKYMLLDVVKSICKDAKNRYKDIRKSDQKILQYFIDLKNITKDVDILLSKEDEDILPSKEQKMYTFIYNIYNLGWLVCHKNKDMKFNPSNFKGGFKEKQKYSQENKNAVDTEIEQFGIYDIYYSNEIKNKQFGGSSISSNNTNVNLNLTQNQMYAAIATFSVLLYHILSTILVGWGVFILVPLIVVFLLSLCLGWIPLYLQYNELIDFVQICPPFINRIKDIANINDNLNCNDDTNNLIEYACIGIQAITVKSEYKDNVKIYSYNVEDIIYKPEVFNENPINKNYMENIKKAIKYYNNDTNRIFDNNINLSYIYNIMLYNMFYPISANFNEHLIQLFDKKTTITQVKLKFLKFGNTIFHNFKKKLSTGSDTDENYYENNQVIKNIIKDTKDEFNIYFPTYNNVILLNILLKIYGGHQMQNNQIKNNKKLICRELNIKCTHFNIREEVDNIYISKYLNYDKLFNDTDGTTKRNLADIEKIIEYLQALSARMKLDNTSDPPSETTLFNILRFLNIFIERAILKMMSIHKQLNEEIDDSTFNKDIAEIIKIIIKSKESTESKENNIINIFDLNNTKPLLDQMEILKNEKIGKTNFDKRNTFIIGILYSILLKINNSVYNFVENEKNKINKKADELQKELNSKIEEQSTIRDNINQIRKDNATDITEYNNAKTDKEQAENQIVQVNNLKQQANLKITEMDNAGSKAKKKLKEEASALSKSVQVLEDNATKKKRECEKIMKDKISIINKIEELEGKSNNLKIIIDELTIQANTTGYISPHPIVTSGGSDNASMKSFVSGQAFLNSTDNETELNQQYEYFLKNSTWENILKFSEDLTYDDIIKQHTQEKKKIYIKLNEYIEQYVVPIATAIPVVVSTTKNNRTKEITKEITEEITKEITEEKTKEKTKNINKEIEKINNDLIQKVRVNNKQFTFSEINNFLDDSIEYCKNFLENIIIIARAKCEEPDILKNFNILFMAKQMNKKDINSTAKINDWINIERVEKEYDTVQSQFLKDLKLEDSEFQKKEQEKIKERKDKIEWWIKTISEKAMQVYGMYESYHLSQKIFTTRKGIYGRQISNKQLKDKCDLQTTSIQNQITILRERIRPLLIDAALNKVEIDRLSADVNCLNRKITYIKNTIINTDELDIDFIKEQKEAAADELYASQKRTSFLNFGYNLTQKDDDKKNHKDINLMFPGTSTADFLNNIFVDTPIQKTVIDVVKQDNLGLGYGYSSGLGLGNGFSRWSGGNSFNFNTRQYEIDPINVQSKNTHYIEDCSKMKDFQPTSNTVELWEDIKKVELMIINPTEYNFDTLNSLVPNIIKTFSLYNENSNECKFIHCLVKSVIDRYARVINDFVGDQNFLKKCNIFFIPVINKPYLYIYKLAFLKIVHKLGENTYKIIKDFLQIINNNVVVDEKNNIKIKENKEIINKEYKDNFNKIYRKFGIIFHPDKFSGDLLPLKDISTIFFEIVQSINEQVKNFVSKVNKEEAANKKETEE